MKSPAPVFFLFAAFGLLFALIGCAGLLHPVMLMSKGEVADGTVVSYTEKGRRGVRARVVQFTTADGEAITFTSGTSSNASSTPIGEHVRVLYHRAPPRLPEIDDFQSLWLLPTVFGGLGSLCAYVGFAGLFQLRKQNKDSAAELKGPGAT